MYSRPIYTYQSPHPTAPGGSQCPPPPPPPPPSGNSQWPVQSEISHSSSAFHPYMSFARPVAAPVYQQWQAPPPPVHAQYQPRPYNPPQYHEPYRQQPHAPYRQQPHEPYRAQLHEPYRVPQPHEPYRVPQHQCHQPAVSRPSKRRFEFFCEPCTKGFDCEEDYDIHLAEDHVVCSHAGCGFSAREDVVRAHRAKHEVADSPEEIEAWLAMRRFKFPRGKKESLPVSEPTTVSKLETFIRSSLRQAAIEGRKRRKERETKAPCIHWERTGRCQFGDKCSFAHEKIGVCTFFVNHGRCRHGDACKYKHVRRNSKELEENRNPHGHLMRKLLGPEIDKFETQMLQVVQHMVKHGFYQGGVEKEPEAEKEEEWEDEEEEEDDDDEEE